MLSTYYEDVLRQAVLLKSSHSGQADPADATESLHFKLRVAYWAYVPMGCSFFAELRFFYPLYGSDKSDTMRFMYTFL